MDPALVPEAGGDVQHPRELAAAVARPPAGT
jgi:hypothetical protein